MTKPNHIVPNDASPKLHIVMIDKNNTNSHQFLCLTKAIKRAIIIKLKGGGQTPKARKARILEKNEQSEAV